MAPADPRTRPSTPPAGSIPPPGDHGDDAQRVAVALGLDPSQVLDLATTLNPFAPDVAAIVASHLESLAHYPDEQPARASLAAQLGVDVGRLVLTNGGAEAIALVANHLGRGWVEGPEFSLYARHLHIVDPAAGRWRSNPNNPLGTLADHNERAAVWDEAFFPITTGRWTRGDDDAWTVGSLTKLLACPGLRVGYAIAPSAAHAAALDQLRPRWSVNGLVCSALTEMLERVDLPTWSRRVAEQRAALVALLTRHGLEVDPGVAPWVLVRASTGLRDRLAPHGVVVRDCTSFGLPDRTRIAVPDDTGLERLAAALGNAGFAPGSSGE